MLYDGSTFTHGPAKIVFRFRTEYDETMGPPWEEHDGHGIISGWTTRAKTPGERVLVEDRGSRRYYDIEATMKIALRDGWDAPPYKTGTKRQTAARAVEADYQFCAGWANDRWHWIGVIVTREDTGEERSLWGIEDDAGSYLDEVAHDLAEELLREDRDAERADYEATKMIAPWPDLL